MGERRFEAWENEGSFFAEFFLNDRLTNLQYSLNEKVPRKIQRLFAQELLDRRTANPHEIRVLIEFIRWTPPKKIRKPAKKTKKQR